MRARYRAPRCTSLRVAWGERACAVLVILHICLNLITFIYTHTLQLLLLLLPYSKWLLLQNNIMPSRKPRVALTMPDDLNALFDRISELNGTPKTKLIVELLQAYEPVLVEMLDTLEKIHADKENAQKLVKEFGQNLVMNASSIIGEVSKEVQDL